MMPKILKVDFNESANVWIIQLAHPDGRRCQAQIGKSAFHSARSSPMGQFMLLSWFARASALPEEAQATE